MSLSRSQTALGAYYRRLAYRVGKAKAITATARKLALFVYRVLAGTMVYNDPGADAYDTKHTQRSIRALRRRAAQLGYQLVTPDELEPAVVS